MTETTRPARAASRERTTKETSISISLDVDGPAGSVSVSTQRPPQLVSELAHRQLPPTQV